MAYSVVLKVLTASLIIRSMATSQTGRVKVPSNKKAWSVPWPDYQPVRGTLVDGMMGQSYCDPEIGYDYLSCSNTHLLTSEQDVGFPSQIQ